MMPSWIWVIVAVAQSGSSKKRTWPEAPNHSRANGTPPFGAPGSVLPKPLTRARMSRLASLRAHRAANKLPQARGQTRAARYH